MVEPAEVVALVAVEVEGLEEARVEALGPAVVWEVGQAEVVGLVAVEAEVLEEVRAEALEPAVV